MVWVINASFTISHYLCTEFTGCWENLRQDFRVVDSKKGFSLLQGPTKKRQSCLIGPNGTLFVFANMKCSPKVQLLQRFQTLSKVLLSHWLAALSDFYSFAMSKFGFPIVSRFCGHNYWVAQTFEKALAWVRLKILSRCPLHSNDK